MDPDRIRIRNHFFNNIYNKLKEEYGTISVQDFINYAEKKIKNKEEKLNEKN